MLSNEHLGLPSYHSLESIHSDSKECMSNKNVSETGGSFYPVEQFMLRTQMLLLDFKQFRAARTIQRHIRGFIVRQRMHRQQIASAIIQRTWRLYISKRHLITFAQERAQDSIQIMYHTSSLKIQALFRGWWSRKYINNMLYLKNIQLQGVEELIYAYALKLHTMMRTGHLPGYVSLAEGPNNEKVKDLLILFTYRFYNRYVCNKYIVTKTDMEKHHHEFMNSAFTTRVPYMGFDHDSACKRWATNYDIVPKDYTNREYDILQAFMTQSRLTDLQKRFLEKEKELRKSTRRSEKENLFCRDVANSMRFWHACKVCKPKITDSLMGEQFESYLTDVKVYLENMHYVTNCNCFLDKKQPELLKCKSKTISPSESKSAKKSKKKKSIHFMMQ